MKPKAKSLGLEIPAMRSRWGACALALFAMGIASASEVEKIVGTVRKEAEVALAGASTDAEFKKFDLVRKYVAALKDLEKKIAGEGDLDAVIHIREEIASIEKSGEATAHDDKALVDLRAIFLKSRQALDDELAAGQVKLIEGYAKKIQAEESALTKAGRIDDALALRKEWQQVVLELSPGSAADLPFEEDPRVTSPSSLPAIDVPAEEPPAMEKPFALKEWMESMTLPVAKQRIREPISVGDRGKGKNPLIVIPPGSVWAGSGSGRIFLSFGRFVARKSRFEKMTLESDHASYYYFIASEFDDCLFKRGGIWWGGLHPAKFYFGNCLVTKRFMGPKMKVEDYGIRADRCVFQGIEFGEVRYEKHQPAKFINERWFKLVNCRFVKCTLPAGLLLQTRDCVFEDCIFIDDSELTAELDEFDPMETVLYVTNCKTRISKLPAGLKLIEKPVGELKGAAVPTAANVLSGAR